jgi:predicted NBD/HSP70 family sugar kinase
VGKGIGLGIVLEGKPFGGAMGFSGEVGHIQVAQNGKLCECGKTGCLQTVASTRVIEEEARKRIAWGEATLLEEEAPSSQKVIDAALKGDAFSIEILDSIAGELGKGVAILVHLFNPDIVVINGDIADAGALVRVPVIGKLRKLTFPEYYNYTRIAISELKNNAVIYGAMAIVYEHIFQSA